VWYNFTDVSDEVIASNFRVEDYERQSGSTLREVCRNYGGT
jgi:hypothetical protein